MDLDRLLARARPAERAAALPGDDIVTAPDVVMDRAFDLPAPPAAVWPWFVQLGKDRAGWYLPRRVEALLPPRGRGLRHLDPALQHLAAGEVVPDWGGKDATFEIVAVDAPRSIVHRSTRGRLFLTWTVALAPAAGATRVHLRLRLAGVKRRWLVEYGGGLLDLLTVAGLAAGLRERV